MSLAQAFQTAAAYRQSVIDQNQQAAMQTPMLAVQALSVGLQAQAQQQDMQFKMQSMVLQTQLQIEETKTKQAMQLMEFDLKSRQLNANEQIARQELELARQRTTAQVAASGLQAQEAQAGLAQTMNAQSARTALGMLRSKYTDQQILSGAAEEEMREFAQTNPAAFGILQEDLSKTAQASSTALRSEMIQIERAMNEDIRESTRGLSAPQAMAARSRLEQHYLGVLQQKEQQLSGLERRPPRSFTAAPSIADLFPSRSGLDSKTAIDALAEIRQTMSTLDPVADKDQMDSLRTRQESLLESLVPTGRGGTTEPKETPLQAELAKATAARAALRTSENRTRSPQELVKTREKDAALSHLDAWEGTVGSSIVPKLDSVINTSNDPEQLAEAQKLRNILDAAMEATRRGITGTRKRDWTGVNDGATAQRELAPSEPRPYPVFGGPGVQAPPMQPAASTTVRSFTRAELDSLAQDPSYENVKRILSRLEVR